MNCKKILSCLNAYVDGEAPESLRRIMELHLTVCESCRGRLEELRGLDELFQNTLAVPPVPEDLAVRIMAEARSRQPMGIPKRYSPWSVWNPLAWIAKLSAPMRLASCATVLLAIVTGLALEGRDVTERKILIEQGKDTYGLEWFSSVPPSSIGSTYIAMAKQSYEKRSEQ